MTVIGLKIAKVPPDLKVEDVLDSDLQFGQSDGFDDEITVTYMIVFHQN